MRRYFAIFLMVPILSACSSRISIPVAPPINRITVTDTSTHQNIIITDPARIADIIGFLSAHDTGWNSPPGTFPTPNYNVTFESAGEFQYVLWISLPSADWIGFRPAGKSAPDNLLRDISPTEHADLLHRLGL